MAIQHVFSNAIPDGTNTNIVRPSDWNSAHNNNVTLSGNTLGVSTVSGTNIVLAGGPNVTLSAVQGADVATISFSGGAGAAGNTGYVSAGTTNASLGTLSFANGGGVSFGIDGQTITATVATNYLTTAMASNRGSDFVQANAAFNGTNASGTIASNAISVSVAAQSVQPVAASAANGSAAFSTLSFSNANGISFVTAAGPAIVASHNALTSQSNQAFSADASSTFQTLSFQNSNGVSFSNNAGALRVTHELQFTSATSAITSNALHSSASRVINIVAATDNTGGGTASLSSNVSFSAANGLTFYTSAGNAIVGSYSVPTVPAQLSVGASNLGNTAGDTGVFTGRVVFVGSDNITLSGSSNGGSATISLFGPSPAGGGITNIRVSAGTTSNLLSAITFADGNGISFGINASTLTASYTVPTVTNSSWSVSDAATSGTVGRLAFTNLNGVTLSLSTGAGGSHTIVGSHNALTSQSNQNVTAANGGFAFQTLSFSNLNGISFGTSAGSAITASHNAITTGRASNDAVGLNTAQSNVTWTVNSAGLSLDARGYAGTGSTFAGANISGSMTINSVGVNLSMSVAAPGAAAEANWIHALGANTAGNTTVSGSTLGFSGVNLTLSGTNNSQLVLSAPATSSLSATGLVSISVNGSTISIGVPSNTATMWFPFNEGVNVAGQQGQATMQIAPVPTPPTAANGELQVDRVAFPLQLTYATNSTGSVTLSMWMALYTKNVSTLSLNHSTSFTTAFTFSGTANSSIMSGIRLHTIPWTTTFQDNRYYVGVASQTTTGGANATLNQMLISQVNSNFSGLFGVATNRSYQWPLGFGVLSASTTQVPSSIAFSNINGTASLAARAPSWVMLNGTA